jgi:hypothetical protein
MTTKEYSNGVPWQDCSLPGQPCRQNGSVQISYGMLGFVPSAAPKEGMWLSVIEGEYLASKIEREASLGELYSGAGTLPIKRLDPHSGKSISQKTQAPQSEQQAKTSEQSAGRSNAAAIRHNYTISFNGRYRASSWNAFGIRFPSRLGCAQPIQRWGIRDPDFRDRPQVKPQRFSNGRSRARAS